MKCLFFEIFFLQYFPFTIHSWRLFPKFPRIWSFDIFNESLQAVVRKYISVLVQLAFK